MAKLTVADINQYSGTTINPPDNPDEVYELYSVPSFDSQYPEIIKGSEIGSSKITVEDGDVLVCKINPRINRVWVVKHHTDHPLLASSEWIVIRNSKMDSNYLKWYFSSPTFRNLLVSQVAGIGGSLTRAQPKQVAKYPVPIVDICEQRRIAAVLNKVSGLIAKRREQLDKLDELVKARFVEMFGDPVSNPYNWEKVSLSELADIRIGPFGSLLHKEDYIEGGHPLVNPSHIIDGKIVIDEKLTVSHQKYVELEAYHLKAGDVVMGRRGEMGRCAVVSQEDLLCGTGSLLIRPKGKVTADYIQKIISFPSFKKMIEDMAVGQTMPNLNVPIVSAFQIIKPPVQVQENYYTFVTQVDKSKLTIRQSLDKLEVLKKALMQQYFG
ncbi:restriction endonuclease subunit S [Dysosmobacter welbionis]